MKPQIETHLLCNPRFSNTKKCSVCDIELSDRLVFCSRNSFCEKTRKFHIQWCTTSKREDAKNFVDNSLNVLQDIQSDIYKILDQLMSQETAIKSTTRGVSFGEVSVSVFTTATEDTPKSKTLTNTIAVDSGGQTVPGTDSRKNVEDSPKPVSSVAMLINRSLEDEFTEEGAEKCRCQLRVKQRQEKAIKKAEIEMKKLELEFERKRRDHAEQMRRLEDKLQIKMIETELEPSSGEQPDESKPSSEPEAKVEKRSTAARSLKSDESEEYAENTRVSLPRQDLFLSGKTHKTYVQQLEDYRKQCSSDEDYENLFEYDMNVESTPIRGFRDFNRHDNSRNFVSSQMSYSFKRPTFSIAPTANSQRSLPMLKVRDFDVNPLDWPEWSGMFLATVDSSNISKDEKMSHLKTILLERLNEQTREWATLVLCTIMHGTPCKESLVNIITLSRLSWRKYRTSVMSGSRIYFYLLNLRTQFHRL